MLCHPCPIRISHYYFIKELLAVTGERGAERTPRLVDLDAPLALLLQVGDEVVVRQALLPADLLEHVLDAGHHALEAAEVHDGAVLEALKDLVGVLLDLCAQMSRRALRRRCVERRKSNRSDARRRETHLVLDVHLAALLVLLLARERVVHAEVVGEFALGRLPV